MAKAENLEKSTISGHVYSTSGAVLHGARVTCELLNTVTLADGFYVLNNLPTGTYEVTVSLKGYQSQSQNIPIQDNETVVRDFDLSKAFGTAKIFGHVYDDETNKPIVNKGTIILILPISNRYAHIDADGYYELDNLPKGTYTLSASIPEYFDCDADLTIAEGESIEHDFVCTINRTVEPSWG